MTIEPPRPTALPNTSATTGPATQATAVREAPAGLRAATAGTVITATVAGRDAQGHLMLRTANGMLTLATHTNPPIGAQVTLQLRPAGAQMQAYILSIRAPGDSGGHPTTGHQQTATGTPNRPTTVPTPMPATHGGADRLSAGTPLRATVATGPASAPTVDGNGTQLPRLQQGNTVDVHLLRVQAPDSTAPPAANRIAGGDGIARPMVVSGRVLPTDGGSGVLLRTPIGTLRLPLASPPPPGTLMTLELTLPSRAGVSAGATTATPQMAAPALTRAWPALQEAMAAVQRPGVPADQVDLIQTLTSAGNPIAQAVPRAGPTLGAGLLFLMTALKGGDMARWLSAEPLRTLERAGRSDLVTRLKADFGQLSRLTQDAGGDWRLFALPVIGDGDVRPVRFFLRKHDDEEEDGKRHPNARPPGRFVVELTLSQLGELQLDGLARPERLDAVLRSRQALPESVRRDITQIFDDQLAVSGLYGELRFEASTVWHFIEIAGSEHTGLSA
ncbi:hypothetical protein [Rhodovibrio salinarum]|uniref:Hook-length control protein FliK n=1 Tax=Rhodovibrio salinarum TaxID=1087 RepID=A0A934QL18_9PROT|nr:hypothetical protein [Rhodovibrio salinarum]MBK1698851.1 hypothetical protein [Rhodovibrio salinarum]